jgi:hypothetical protein
MLVVDMLGVFMLVVDRLGVFMLVVERFGVFMLDVGGGQVWCLHVGCWWWTGLVSSEQPETAATPTDYPPLQSKASTKNLHKIDHCSASKASTKNLNKIIALPVRPQPRTFTRSLLCQ